MPRSLQEIDADIAQVKAEIALRDKYIQGFNQPQTKVGWGSYIVNNDRGLLDQYQNRENQWKNAIEQQLFQAEQNRLSRESAEKIAGVNKAIAEEEKMDDYMRQRNRAITTLNYAKQRLDATPKENKAEYEAAARDVALAQHDVNYYNKKVGYKEPEAPVNDEQETPKTDSRDESKSVPVKITDSKAIKRFKTKAERKAHADKLAAMDPEGQSKEIQEEINRINGLDTDEDKAERKKAWEAGKTKSGFAFRKWKESKEGKKLIAEFGE